MKKCSNTTSGRHIYEKTEIGRRLATLGKIVEEIPIYLPQCIACKIIDDRPLRKGKK